MGILTEHLKTHENLDEFMFDYKWGSLDAKQKADKISNIINKVNELNDKLVPKRYEANTVAGELIRALFRIRYRFYNDGDVVIPIHGGGCSEYVNGSYCYIWCVLRYYAYKSRGENYNKETEIEKFINGELEHFSRGTCETDLSNKDNYDFLIQVLANVVILCIDEFELEKVENKDDSRDFGSEKNSGYCMFGGEIRGSFSYMETIKNSIDEIFGEEVSFHDFDAVNGCYGLRLDVYFSEEVRLIGQIGYRDGYNEWYVSATISCKCSNNTYINSRDNLENSIEPIDLEVGEYKVSLEDFVKYLKKVHDMFEDHEDGSVIAYAIKWSTEQDLIGILGDDDKYKEFIANAGDEKYWIKNGHLKTDNLEVIACTNCIFIYDEYLEDKIQCSKGRSKTSVFVKENFTHLKDVEFKTPCYWCDDTPSLNETEHAVILERDTCNDPTYVVVIFPKNNLNGYAIMIDNHYSNDIEVPEGQVKVTNAFKYKDGFECAMDSDWPFWKTKKWDDEKDYNVDELRDQRRVNYEDIQNELPEEFNTVDKLIDLAAKYYNVTRDEYINWNRNTGTYK